MKHATEFLKNQAIGENKAKQMARNLFEKTKGVTKK